MAESLFLLFDWLLLRTEEDVLLWNVLEVVAANER